MNCPANRVRRGVRVDAGGAGPGWGAWDQPCDAASAVRAVAAIRLRRDIVIVSPPSARSREAHDRQNAAVAQGDHYTLLTDNLDKESRLLRGVSDANEV